MEALDSVLSSLLFFYFIILYLGAFKKGEDYDVHCTSGGIHLSSYNSQFVLTAKSKTKDPKCVENTEFYPLTGLTNMFIPNCLTIQEHFKSWLVISNLTVKFSKCFNS